MPESQAADGSKTGAWGTTTREVLMPHDTNKATNFFSQQMVNPSFLGRAAAYALPLKSFFIFPVAQSAVFGFPVAFSLCMCSEALLIFLAESEEVIKAVVSESIVFSMLQHKLESPIILVRFVFKYGENIGQL